MIRIKLLPVFILILFFGCKSDLLRNKKTITKFQNSDKFKNTIIKSQFYKIKGSKDNAITTKKGNVLIIPSGSLLDNKGKIIEDSIQIEFAEGTDIDEIILSNLMIQDSVKVYESYLSFFFNATRNGKQLQINPEDPVFFEVPADKKVSLYKGIRDKLGNMKWRKDKDPLDYLIPVSLDLLDFYPEGFEREVEKGLPYRNHKIVTKTLLDSLYYSFATEIDKSGYYNWSSRLCVINFITPILHLIAQEPSLLEEIQSDSLAGPSICGINPASIKALRSKKFRNTLISTREFQYRLKTIFATCDNKVLELYVNNLNKNLWEIDDMAAKYLGKNNKQYSKFLEFSSYKQTTVKLSDRKAKLLAEYYKKSKKKNERELLKLKKEFLKKKQKHEQIVQQKKEEYRKLLEERHVYRMQKFGFELTSFGWYNAAHAIKLNEVKKFDLNITVTNGIRYDRIYCYVVNPKIKSIFSYLSDNKKTFDIVYSQDPDLLLWKNQKFNVIGVGYLDNKIGYKIVEEVQKPVVNVDFELVNRDYKSFRKDLKTFTSGYERENKILVDLDYQAFFYQEQLRKKKEVEEFLFINKLRSIVFPCCDWNWDLDSYPAEYYMKHFI